MILDNAEKLRNVYMDWIKEDLEFQNLDENYVSISTPFIDNDYDNINLYASFVNKNIIKVSDFGFTLYNLTELGINLTPKFKTGWHIFREILDDFGISNDKGTLCVQTPIENFPMAKTRLLQAVMRVNDIFYLSKHNVVSSFNDIIAEFFNKNNILYTPSFEIPNPFGASSHFDFAIPNRKDGERVVKTVSRPNDINQAKIFNFDVRATARSRNAKFILLVNNTKEKKLNGSLVATAMNELSDTTASVLGFEEVQENNTELINA